MVDYYATPAPRLGGFTTGKAPLAGSFTAVGASAWFTPAADRPFNISLSGTFVASVRLERSRDKGVTAHPLTAQGTAMNVWTTPVSENWEESETGWWYRLNCTAFTSGQIDYEVSQ